MDHRATANIAEMVTAEHTIATLKLQVQQLQELNDIWGMTIDVSVENFDGSYGIELIVKGNNKEYRERLSGADVAYFNDDIFGAATQFVTRFVGPFQRDVVMNNFLPKLQKAFTNVLKLNKGI